MNAIYLLRQVKCFLMNWMKPYLLFSFYFFCSVYGFPSSNDPGEALFRDHCASCHEFGRILTGPDLTNIQDLRTEEWLIHFIRNSQEVINQRDPIAIELYAQYKFTEMPPMELSDDQIRQILGFIASYSSAAIPAPAKKKNELAEKKDSLHRKLPNYAWYFISGATLALLWIVLSILAKLSASQKGSKKIKGASEKLRELNRFIFSDISPVFHFSVLFSFILIGITMTYSYYQNKKLYDQPLSLVQQIDFSHDIHYNTYQIDCIYCHLQAVNNTFANLPDNNHCLKCHDYIRKGEKTDTIEIYKLISNAKKGTEVRWEKGYRLSYYVHFDHGIHNQTDCITCHVNIVNPMIIKAEMNMKWCMDCHKKEFINTSGNYYKKIYEASVRKKGLFVKDAGGIDCNVCHY